MSCIIGNFSDEIRLIIQGLPTDEFWAATEFCECCAFAMIVGYSFDWIKNRTGNIYCCFYMELIAK